MTAGTANSQQAFRAVLAHHLDALYRTAYRMLRDEHAAQDAVQEALDKAWRHLDKFDPGTNMKSWVFRILTNTCRDQLRARKRWSEITVETSEQSTDAEADWRSTFRLPDESLGDAELGNAIEAAIDQLSGVQQVVVHLVIVEQYSYEEAAKTLSLPVGTVRSRLSRARAILCASLADQADADVTDTGRIRRLKVVK